MKSFEDLYCETHRCSSVDFRKRVFWRCLPWRAKLLAPVLGGFSGQHFGPDRAFLDAVARTVDMVQFRAEVRDYFENPQNRGWLRQVMDIRISTRRFRSLARRFLPDPSLEIVPLGDEGSSTPPMAVDRSKPARVD